MSIESELYTQAMDKYEDEERAAWEARMELESLARQGNDDAISALSKKPW